MPTYTKQRLQELYDKFRTNTATPAERDEYLEILYHNGTISTQEYETFKRQRVNEDVDTLLKIGAIGLAAYAIFTLFSGSKD